MRAITTYVLVFFLFSTLGCDAQTTVPSAYHVETIPTKHIRATLTDTWETPKLIPHRWAVFTPVPPSFSGQDHVKTTLLLGGFSGERGQTRELSPLQRPVLWARTTAPKGADQKAITIGVLYEMTLYSRRISPGPASTPVLPLSGVERTLNLRRSETIDFQSQTFQNWLDTTYLHRPTSERDLDFGFRVYQMIRRRYHYHYDPEQDRKASKICLIDQSDCGGLSFLFVSAMRANGIPAHALAGRLARTALTPQDYGNCHVRSEFYADGIGWVPVDMSYGVGASDENALRYFGNDPGDLIVMHQDTDFMLSPGSFGPKTSYLMQKPVHYVWGSGSLSGSTDRESWLVEELLPEPT